MYYDRIIPMKEELSIDIIGLAGACSYALDCIEAELSQWCGEVRTVAFQGLQLQFRAWRAGGDSQ